MGAALVAISMDSAENAANMATYVGAEFLVLADPLGSAARDYGVYNLLGDGVAAPATFIIARDGTIGWRYVGQDAADRPSAAETLLHLRQLGE